MSAAKSHRAGRATLVDDGAITAAYRAVVAIPCAQCGKIIAPGDLFSRRTKRASIGSMGLTLTEPICATCRPLRLDDANEQQIMSTTANPFTALYWISTPRATFGVVTERGIVTQAAPIARWTIGKTIEPVLDYYRQRGAIIKEVGP